MKNETFVGGCLSQEIDQAGILFRFIESFGNTRVKLTKVFYGESSYVEARDAVSNKA